MQFIFIGGTYRGYKLFLTLVENKFLPDYAFILKEDKHETLKYSKEIVKLSEKYKIRYCVKKKITNSDIQIFNSAIRDFAIICGWRTIISTQLNDYFKLGMIAAHDSLLPAYRGFAPINWCIINGEKQTGVTLFRIEVGEVDSGPIFIQKKVFIDKGEYAQSVCEKITDATIDAFFELIDKYEKGSLKKKYQNEKQASYTCKRSPEDGEINWHQPAEKIFNLIRALAPPYPGAFCYYKKNKYIICQAKIGRNNKIKYVGNIVGRVIKIFEDSIEVLCESGTIEILEWINTKKGIKENPSLLIRSIKDTLV